MAPAIVGRLQRLRSKSRYLYLPLLLAPFVMLSPILFRGQAMFWGTPLLQFVPWRVWAWETLQTGHLPLWNPLSGMGAPLFANYQSALLYPPHLAYFLLAALGGAPAIAWGQGLLVGAHFAWAGFGMARLVRRLGLGVEAQVIGGLSFGLSGYIVAKSGFLSINAAAAWTPWALLAISGLPWIGPGKPARSGAFAFAVAGMVFGLQLFSGHAQTTWYTWLLAGMWAGYWGWKRGNSSHSQMDRNGEETQSSRTVKRRASVALGLGGIARAWAALALVIAVGCLLASVQLVPTVEYLLQSQRSSAVEYEFAMTYSFWPWRLITLFAPDFFGSPVTGDYWGYATYWEDTLYIGLLPALLALGSILRRRNLALIALIAVSLLLALGQNTPVFPWLYRHVPTFSMFQAPARYLLWATFALTLLASLAVDRWRRPEGRALYWTRLGTAGALAATLGAGLGWYLLSDVSPTFIRATAIAGLLGAIAGSLSLLAPPADAPPEWDLAGWKRTLWDWAVIIFVAVDLVVAGYGLNPGVSLSLYERPAPFLENRLPEAGEGRLFLPKEDEQVVKFEVFFRFDTFQPSMPWENVRATMLPNTNLIDGVSSVNNFDPLVPGRYARWMEYMEDASPLETERMLNLMAVSVVEKVDPGSPIGVRYEPLSNPGSRVRWLTCAARAGGENEAFVQTLEQDACIVLEGEDVSIGAAGVPTAALTGTAGRAEVLIVQQTPNLVELAVSASEDGWVLLSDVWYPGWRASVDGSDASLLRANYLFRGVAVPAGEHVVSFQYRPLSFWLGALISLFSWTGLALVWLWRALPRTRSREHMTA